jgi:hypothetical protein
MYGGRISVIAGRTLRSGGMRAKRIDSPSAVKPGDPINWNDPVQRQALYQSAGKEAYQAANEAYWERLLGRPWADRDWA